MCTSCGKMIVIGEPPCCLPPMIPKELAEAVRKALAADSGGAWEELCVATVRLAVAWARWHRAAKRYGREHADK